VSFTRVDFRPDIEGLRAVAILAVVAFHAGQRGGSGGFVALDVFFVISGFLITRLLWAELVGTCDIRLGKFYAARVRRLLPASAVVLIVTAVAAVWLLPPLEVPSALGDGLAAALYVVNYRYAINGTDYLAQEAVGSPFQHYWSLSLEEQFYLIWPALLLLWALWFRRRGGAPSAKLVIVGLAGLAVVSLCLSVLWSYSVPVGGVVVTEPWAYFSLPSRAWQFVVGGLVALSAPALSRLKPAVARIVGLTGTVWIAVAVVTFDTNTPYPGIAAVLPVLGAALIIGAGCALPTGGVGRVLSLAPMRAVGRVSYSWYLWHWPLLVFTPLLISHYSRLVAVAASFGLAVLTTRYLERPIRYAPALRVSTAKSLAVGALCTVVAVAATAVLPKAQSPLVGRGAPGAAIATTDSAAEIRRLVDISARGGELPVNLSPQLSDVPAVVRALRGESCIQGMMDVDVADCVAGDPDGVRTVALVGDSHAMMWEPAIDDIARQHHWRLLPMAKSSCPLLDRPIVNPYLGRRYSECDQWRSNVLGRLEAVRPEVVILSLLRKYGAEWGLSPSDPAWSESLAELIGVLQTATGGQVLVLGPVPNPGTDVPVCLSGHVDNIAACMPPRQAAVKSAVIAAEEAVTASRGGQYFDVTQFFCTESECPVVIGKYLVFRDRNHVTAEYARALAGVLSPVLTRAMATR